MTDLETAIAMFKADMGCKTYGLQHENDFKHIILNAVASGDLITVEASDARAGALLREAVVAGWNSCRLSVYAVCEYIQDREAEEIADQGDYAQGYKCGLKRSAKSIARGFGAMEAVDDDGTEAAILALSPDATAALDRAVKAALAVFVGHTPWRGGRAQEVGQ